MNYMIATKQGGYAVEMTSEEVESTSAERSAAMQEKEAAQDAEEQQNSTDESLKNSIRLKLLLSEDELKLLFKG